MKARDLAIAGILLGGVGLLSGCQTPAAFSDSQRLATEFVPRLIQPGSPPDAAQGRQFFAQYCTTCHRPDGRGLHDGGGPDFTDPQWLWDRMPSHFYELVYWGEEAGESEEWDFGEEAFGQDTDEAFGAFEMNDDTFDISPGMEEQAADRDAIAAETEDALEIVAVGEDEEVSHPGFSDRLRPEEVWVIVYYIWQLSSRREALRIGDADAGMRQVFLTNCATCHGVYGNGDGPNAPFLVPPPRNFQDQGFMIGAPNERLFTSISEGRPETAMAAWQDYGLDEATRRALVDYLRTLSYQPEPLKPRPAPGSTEGTRTQQ